MKENAKKWAWSFFILLFLVNNFLGINYLVLRATKFDLVVVIQAKLDQTAEMIVIKLRAWNQRRQAESAATKLISVSESEFEKLFQELCPELLVKSGIPLSKVYADMLKQYTGEKINEAFVRALLDSMKQKETHYDGKEFYGFKQGAKPNQPISTELLEKDDVPVGFYLQNERFYTPRIFEILTRQNRVSYVHEWGDKGYLFQTNADMTMLEFVKIVSDGKTPTPEMLIKKGQRYWIESERVRKVSRIFKIAHSFNDHRGAKRSITVHLDISRYSESTAMVSVLPDDTIVADESGVLSIGKSSFFVQRVNGKLKQNGEIASYIENGKELLRMNGARLLSCEWCPADMAEATAQVFSEPETGREILQITIKDGSWEIHRHDGSLARKIKGRNVFDAHDQAISDPNDIGVKVSKQIYTEGGKLTQFPDLMTHLDTDLLMQKLVADISAPYQTNTDKAKAILAFVQSFKYRAGRVLGAAKSPKDFLLSKDGDCEDSTIFTMSLWKTAGFRTGYITLRSTKPGAAGHVAPLISKQSCCDGEGIDLGGERWLFAEPTSPDWKIGESPRYEERGLRFSFLTPPEGAPLPFKK